MNYHKVLHYKMEEGSTVFNILDKFKFALQCRILNGGPSVEFAGGIWGIV